MVPDKFNMVDMDGIDLIMAQGEEVAGLYNRLVESIAQCRYQCLYNWFFDGVAIPPTYVELEVNENDEVAINEGVTVSEDDVIHIYSLLPPAPEPEIIPLLAEENGVYNVPTGKDGFNPVTVDVPSYTPIINSLSITENGTYTAPTGVDGYSPVTVNVPSYAPVINPIAITENGTYTVPSGVDGYSPITVNVPSVTNIAENASVFRWVIGQSSTCWGIMKKLSGDVIGQNGDFANANISLVGDLMTVTLHGASQSVEVLATSAIKLKAYKTLRTLGPATMTEYTMAANDQQSFTQDNLYGGIYFEAEAI